MALDATVAGPSADSYLSLVDAAGLATAESESDPEVAAWLKAADVDREAFLRRATSEVDAELAGLPPFSATQALLFPTEDDHVLDVAFIPTSIKRATFYQAIYLATNVTVLSRARTRRARDLQMATEPNTSYVERGGASAGSSAAERQPTILSDRAMLYLRSYQRAIGQGTLRTVRLSAGWELQP